MVAPRRQDYYRERSQHFLDLFDDEAAWRQGSNEFKKDAE